MTQPGNSTCSCNFGYEGTGKQCTLKDVCSANSTSSYQIDLSSEQAGKFVVVTSGPANSLTEVFDVNTQENLIAIELDMNQAFSYQFTITNRISVLNFKPCMRCASYRVQAARTLGFLSSTKTNTFWVRQAGSLISMGKGAVAGKQAVFYHDMTQDAVANYVLNKAASNDQTRDMFVASSGVATFKSHKFGCGVNTDCIMKGFDTPMQTTCTCKEGYRLQTQGTKSACMAINHCMYSGTCASFGSAATCSYTGAGTFDCMCPSGFQKDVSNTTCVEINSCKTDNGGCDANSTCIKTTPGKNKCVCKTGFVSVGGQPCAPVDPCAANNGGCDPNAVCNNTGPGDRTCDCMANFTGNGVYCEAAVQEDGNLTQGVNPCNTSDLDLKHNCDSKFGKCTQRKTATGFSCGCKAGYRCASNACTSCVAVDKCLNPFNGGCGMHAKCTQYDPTAPVVCKCSTGYERATPNSSCTAINACAKSPCAAKQTCTQTGAGSFACACVDGYEMSNGSACIPIDFCQGNVCDANARCVPRPESLSYQCFCNADFNGDGFECTKKLMVTSTNDDIPVDDVEKECDVGKYANYDGTVKVCTPCPANTYNSVRDALSCTPCGAGFTSDVGSDSKGDCYLACPNCGEFDNGEPWSFEEQELNMNANVTLLPAVNHSSPEAQSAVKLVDIQASAPCYAEEAEAYSAAVLHLQAVEIQSLANMSAKGSLSEAKAELASAKGKLHQKKIACAVHDSKESSAVNETTDESLPASKLSEASKPVVEDEEKVMEPVRTEIIPDAPQAGSDSYIPDPTSCEINNGGCSVHAVCSIGLKNYSQGNSSQGTANGVICECGVGYTGNGINCTQVGSIESILGELTNNQTTLDTPPTGSNVSVKLLLERLAGHVEESVTDDSEQAVSNSTNATTDEEEPVQTETPTFIPSESAHNVSLGQPTNISTFVPANASNASNATPIIQVIGEAQVNISMDISFVQANRKKFVDAFASDVANAAGCLPEKVHVTSIAAGSVVTFKIDNVTDPAAAVNDADGSSKLAKSGMNALADLNGKAVEVTQAKNLPRPEKRSAINTTGLVTNETGVDLFADSEISITEAAPGDIVLIGEPIICVFNPWTMDQAYEAEEDQETIAEDAESCAEQGTDCNSDEDGEDSKAVDSVLKLEAQNRVLMKQIFTYLNNHAEFMVIVQIFGNSLNEFMKHNATAHNATALA